VASKWRLLEQAEMLLRLAKHAADPDLAGSLVQKAADLKEQADLSESPDKSPYAPDVER
jgi:hypothetical protein